VIGHIAVVIPAADEEDEIGGCLEALAVARGRLRSATGGTVTSEVTVVLDGCRDRTADIVARFSDTRTVLSSARCVGAARRLGAARALAGRRPAGVWLASTDADCRVPADWLTTMQAVATSGLRVILGTVCPAPGLPQAVEQAWHAAHPPIDDHPHVHGANLGIAAELYRRIGGWHDLTAHEDHDLVARASASGAAIHRTSAIPVLTSSRLSGRVPHGFASYLRQVRDGLPAVG
jgi:glycosyltransferase involved in cell wall biosynthesis